MQDPDRAMEIYLRLRAEGGAQASLQAIAAQQIADRVARIGRTLLTRLVANRCALAVEAEESDRAAAARAAHALAFAAERLTALAARCRHAARRRVRPKSGATRGRVDRRRRSSPAGALANPMGSPDPMLLHRRAAEERERAMQAVNASAERAHRRLANLYQSAAHEADTRRRQCV